MKKILLAASLVAGVAAYFIVKETRKTGGAAPGFKPKGRHFTKLFANAKASMS